MKSILKLQDGIYRQYSLYAYGKIQRLSPEEKAMLELYVKVNEGSSWIEIIPEPIIKCVAEKINSMTSNQILAAIAIVSVASVICVVTKKVLDHKQKMKELEVQAETLTGIQKSAAQAQIETIRQRQSFIRKSPSRVVQRILKSTEKKLMLNQSKK